MVSTRTLRSPEPKEPRRPIEDYPSFSVVIPTYQRRDLVCDAVRALCGITYKGAVEIIVVVDGSIDGTAAALKSLNCARPLRVIEQENRGLAGARNRGAAEARGDLLLFLDDDMIPEPDIIEQHARSFRNGADAVAGEFIEPAGPLAGFQTPGIARAKSSQIEASIATPFEVFGGHMSVRRSAFESVSGFDESFTRDGRYGYEDFDLAYRLMRHFSVRRNPNAVSHHRKRVSAREYISRGSRCAKAEVRLREKHPEIRDQLVEWSGASRLSSRLRLLSRIPLLPHIFARIVAFTADIGLKTPLRSSRKLEYLCNAAYTLTYWSTVQRNGGIPAR
jgi:GT2 family glycosyltransferase